MTIIDNMTTESRPIKWVYDEFRAGRLFVDESFQRKSIWLRKDKISLIETVMLGYPIPEIYLWATGTDPETGDTKYSIVDGQQRIRTIGEFISNDLRLTDSGLEFRDADYRGVNFDALGAGRKTAIWSYNISIRFVKQAVIRDDIVKMFLRLNKTDNALNPQELRNAEFNGEFLKASVEVAALDFWKRWGIFSDNDIRRMSDVQFASTLLIFVRGGFDDETTQGAINRMYDLFSEQYATKESDIGEISSVLELLNSLVGANPSLQRAIKKKTHLYTLFTVVFALRRMSGLNYQAIGHALGNWYVWLENDVGAPEQWESEVADYLRLSQEGVQKKANRMSRYGILLDYVQRETA